jgi:uncharacterized protein (TIGR03083 family)
MEAVAATGGMQWQQGDVRVALDVTPADVAAGLARLWRRLLDGVDALAPNEWERPTRCAEWTVVDVVNHLGDTGSWVVDIVDAVAEGRESHVFDNFEPRGVPKRLTDAADRDPVVARRRMSEGFEAVRARLPLLDDREAAQLLLTTPLGPQPPAVGLLHLFWDTWLHERDMFLPLHRPVPELADEVRMAAVYTLRMEGYIQAMFGRELSVGLVLDGALRDTVAVELHPTELRVEVVPPDRTPENVLRGDAATAVDALCGRGALEASLQGPDDVRGSISALRTVLAGA